MSSYAEGVELTDNSYRLSCLIKACRIKNDRDYVRLPIEKGLMRMILDRIEDYSEGRGQSYLAKLYKALISTGYHGLLRVGELTPGTHPILACNMHMEINKREIIIVCDPEIYANNDYCPYMIIKEFINLRPKYHDDDEPVFIFRDRKPVKPWQ